MPRAASLKVKEVAKPGAIGDNVAKMAARAVTHAAALSRTLGRCKR